MKATITFVTFFSLCALITACAETNRFFVTFTPETAYKDETPTVEQIEQAKHILESRPAEQDPDGHWASITEGFQLSVRLAKKSFTNGEPITALLLLRNVTERPLWYPVSSGRDIETAYQLERNGQAVHRKDTVKPGASFSDRLNGVYAGSESLWRCPPGTQRPFHVDLREVFDFTNGTYTLTVKRKVTNQARTDIVEAVSAPATFLVIPP